MIKVKDLEFSYKRGNTILSEIEFETEEGMFIAVLGNNGAGKSTLIKCLNRILKPQIGSVNIDGSDISTLSSNEIARRVAYVSQHNYAEQFTVFDAVLLGRKPYIKFEPTSEDIAIVTLIIDRLGLSEYILRYVNELSGGERQKVMLARALAQQSKVLLLDEPTSNLDLHNQYEVFQVIQEIVSKEKMTVIVVLHDLNLALRFCDRFLFVKDQSIYAYGSHEIMTPENIEAVYKMPVAVEIACGVRVVVPLPIKK